MHLILALSLLMFPQITLSQTNQDRLMAVKELKRISFGSCSNQQEAQPLWKDLTTQKPDLWIWGGDNIYADWTDDGDINRGYAVQNFIPEYQAFKAQIPIVGTWDDHDYGANNADGSYPGKKQSQQSFLDFVDEPAESSRRAQEGIYTSYRFGVENKITKVILLDNRYFKNLEPGYPMLGKKQWEWLEGELTNSEARIHFIVSGLPVTSPLIPYTNEWAETSDLNRMLELIKTTKARGVVFLTGDKHFSSIYKRWGQLEFMSSGMTHVAQRRTWGYLGQKYPTTYFGLSYGQIDISWENEIPIILMSMRTPSGRSVHPSRYKWEEPGWKKISLIGLK